MAELFTTEEERQAHSFLEWDDAALGRAVKKAAIILADRKGGRDAIKHTACASVLVAAGLDNGANGVVVDLHGVYAPDADGQRRELGDWRVMIEPLEDLREPSLAAVVDDAIGSPYAGDQQA